MSQKLSSFGEAFVSYGSYHYDTVNKWIHIFCVPLIAATLICGLSYVPFSFQLKGYTIGADSIAVGVALAYYFSINLLFGFAMTILILVFFAAWQWAFSGMQGQNFFYWVIGIHIVAWVLQFIGHGVFEKRKPALMDNLTQILNAPLFVIVEILEMLGIRSKEMEYWNSLIAKRVTQFRQGQKHQ